MPPLFGPPDPPRLYPPGPSPYPTPHPPGPHPVPHPGPPHAPPWAPPYPPLAPQAPTPGPPGPSFCPTPGPPLPGGAPGRTGRGRTTRGGPGLRPRPNLGYSVFLGGPGLRPNGNLRKNGGGSGRPEASYLNNTPSNRGNFLLLYQTLSVR